MNLVERLERTLLNGLPAKEIVKLTKNVTGVRITNSIKDKESIVNKALKIFNQYENDIFKDREVTLKEVEQILADSSSHFGTDEEDCDCCGGDCKHCG
jgi:hypothetical protein